MSIGDIRIDRLDCGADSPSGRHARGLAPTTARSVRGWSGRRSPVRSRGRAPSSTPASVLEKARETAWRFCLGGLPIGRPMSASITSNNAVTAGVNHLIRIRSSLKIVAMSCRRAGSEGRRKRTRRHWSRGILATLSDTGWHLARVFRHEYTYIAEFKLKAESSSPADPRELAVRPWPLYHPLGRPDGRQGAHRFGLEE
jgi:hypothetical protein